MQLLRSSCKWRPSIPWQAWRASAGARMACSLGKVQSTRQCLPAGSFPSRQDIRLSLNRDFSTERKELPQNEKLSGLQIFVQEANDVAEKSIVKLFACLITAEVVNIFGMKYLIVLLVPADSISFSLNVAYLIFHIPPFRYARYPLNLLFTWGIAKAAPALTQLKLFSKLSSWKASLPQSTKASSISPALNWTTKQLNQYGACFVLGSRFAGSALTICTWLILSYHSEYIEESVRYFGLPDIQQPVLTSYVAALTASSISFPFAIYASVKMAGSHLLKFKK